MENYQKKYKEYMENIKILKQIKLEETVVFKENKDAILRCLKNNNIDNVGELFERDYYKIVGDVNVLFQISGIKNILRYIYLGENLPYIGVLNKRITSREAVKDIFLKFGLSEDFLYHSCTFYFFEGETVYSYLSRILHYSNGIELFNIIDLKKIKIIIDWYHAFTNWQSNKTLDQNAQNLKSLYDELENLKQEKKNINFAIKRVKEDIETTEKARSRILKNSMFSL